MSLRNPLKPEQIRQDCEPEYEDSHTHPSDIPSVYFLSGPGRRMAEEAMEDVEEVREALRVYAEVKAQKAAVNKRSQACPEDDVEPAKNIDWATKEAREYLAHLHAVALPGERTWDRREQRIECGDEVIAYDVSGFDGGNREGKLLVAATNALPHLLAYIERLEEENEFLRGRDPGRRV